METRDEPTARSSIEKLELSSISWMDSIRYDYQADFMNFKLNSGRAYSSVVIIQIIASAVKIGFMLSYPGGPLWAKIVMYGSSVVPVIGWTYTYLYRKYEFSNVIGWQGRRIIILGNLCIILHSLFSGMSLLLWALNRDSCDHPTCLPNFPEKVIPHGLLLQLFTGAVVFPMFYISHDSLAALVSFLTSFSLLMTTMIILDMNQRDILSTLLISAMLLISLSIYEGSVRVNYTLYSKFEKSLRQQLASENKEYLLKLQTEEMRHMIGNVAHDLRTPLHAFQSELEVLRESSQGSVTKEALEQFKSMEQLDRIINFMTMTINRSIDFTKASSGLKLKHDIERINFASTVKWAVGCMNMNLDEHVPIVVCPIPESIKNYIYTDKQWLMENLLCLLSNAKKFTTEGEITVRCSLQSEIGKPDGRSVSPCSPVVNSPAQNDVIDLESPSMSVSFPGDSPANELQVISCKILIEVEDTGIGISEEHRSHLFKPFSQAQRHSGGTGLGLYALSKRMESLGGKCGVKDRADGKTGSCFFILIPYKPDTELNDVSPTSSGNPVYARLRSSFAEEIEDELVSMSEATSRLSSLKILMVDDSSLIRKATSKSLLMGGHQVKLAHHGADGLKILEASRTESDSGEYGFDLILMDMNMPVMDGLEATKRIRAMEATRAAEEPGKGSHIMIIGISADTESEVKLECLACGMDGFLEKPIKVEMVNDLVARLIENSLLEQV